jgi:uncharacterized protein (TIGR03435 family)
MIAERITGYTDKALTRKLDAGSLGQQTGGTMSRIILKAQPHGLICMIERGDSAMFRTAAGFLLFIFSVPGFGQSEATQPTFDVADVKVNKSGEVRMAVDMQGGGRLTMRNVTMKVMIIMAYHVRPDAVTGGPGWLDSDRYDVVAKATQTTVPEDLRRMLQALLAERFKLAIHTEPKMVSAYVLLIGKSGLKLQASDTAVLSEQRCSPSGSAASQKHIICQHISMAALADQLQEQSPRDFDVAVIDQTGLRGSFDFKLDWTPAVRAAETSTEPPGGPTVFEAVETQLGLKLERRKLPLPVIVIDRVERVPVEN